MALKGYIYEFLYFYPNKLLIIILDVFNLFDKTNRIISIFFLTYLTRFDNLYRHILWT